MLNDVGHRRVVAGKPIDDILTVTYVDEGVFCIAPFQSPGPRLLRLVFILAQIPIGGRLRLCRFSRHSDRVEPIRPERFCLEVDHNCRNFSFVGLFCRFRRLSRLLCRPKPMDIVISGGGNSHCETNNTDEYGTEVWHGRYYSSAFDKISRSP